MTLAPYGVTEGVNDLGGGWTDGKNIAFFRSSQDPEQIPDHNTHRLKYTQTQIHTDRPVVYTYTVPLSKENILYTPTHAR